MGAKTLEQFKRVAEIHEAMLEDEQLAVKIRNAASCVIRDLLVALPSDFKRAGREFGMGYRFVEGAAGPHPKLKLVKDSVDDPEVPDIVLDPDNLTREEALEFAADVEAGLIMNIFGAVRTANEGKKRLLAVLELTLQRHV